MAGIDGVAKLLYIMVVDDDEEMNSLMGRKDLPGFRYTRPVLHSTLQFIGCKARHAFKVSQRVFEMMKSGYNLEKLASDFSEVSSEDTDLHPKGETWRHYSAFSNEDSQKSCLVEDETMSKSFEVYKRRTTLVVSRNKFLDVVCEALSEYKYLGPNQRSDLVLACRIRERKESVTVLLCGASGCGKSTLSALLGCRLGVTTIISTDSIRHMMRSFVDEVDNPLLWASTYHAGECLDPSAVAEAKARRRAKKSSGLSSTSPAKDESLSSPEAGKSETCANTTDLISSKQMAVEGFKAQSEMVIDSLDRLITAWEERKESVVVEGVHLSLNFVMGLMKQHPSIIPFMIYIANEDKHLERFAVRAKYMTLDPARNKYVKYIRNIRTIQEYLCKQAGKHLVPKVNNTNVDKSVAAIHATVFSCLRRRETGEHLYDPVTNTASIVDEEYRNQCSANSLNSKGMLQLIQRQGSSRHLMALLNHDGSVVKAWPVDNITGNGSTVLGHSDMNGIGAPVYGPLKISKAEPVNLQFGRFGISAWPDDTGGTSYASSINELRGELTDNGSKYLSSCCSSPRFSDAPAKEPKEEFSVHGSDDEIDEPLESESDSDEDRRDGELHLQHEFEGSVDEEFTKSDEEYDDLAMQDVPKSGYATDNDDEEIKRTPNSNLDPPFPSQNGFTRDPLKQDADEVSASRCKPISESTLMRAFSGPLRVKNEKVANGNHFRFRKRSLSIPTLR